MLSERTTLGDDTMKTRLGSAIRGLAIVVAVACGCLLAGEARAQGPGQKPFESTYRRPNVSAYNQISNFANNPQMAGNIYQQIVQPQQQQQQQQLDMMSQRRDMGRLQNQVQQIQQGTQARQIDSTIRPTGHASTYMNYSHYYPMR
jgi:hypothetical protein